MGTILPYVGDIKDIPKGWALCDGTNNTPDLTGRFLEGVIANPKTYKESGLPNIFGNFAMDPSGSGNYMTHEYNHNGAFYPFQYTGWCGIYDHSGYRTGYVRLAFDASRCSSVYRNDITTVQPASYTVYYIIKIKK